MVRGTWGQHTVTGRTRREVAKKIEALIDEAIVTAFMERNMKGSVEIDGVKHAVFIKSEVL